MGATPTWSRDGRARGIDAWYDEYEIEPGDDVVAKLNEGLAGRDVGLVVFSASTDAGRWMTSEISTLFHERVEAGQQGWPVPVFEDRAGCDRNFEELSRRLLAAAPVVRPAIASHNLRSVAHAIAAARDLGAEEELELQVLRGLGDDLAHALGREQYRVRAYCPLGDLVEAFGEAAARGEEADRARLLGRAERGQDLLRDQPRPQPRRRERA